MEEALHWLRKVPATATPGFMASAGAQLLRSPYASFQSVGREMLARAGAAGQVSTG